ncbi:MAG: hypothetical protein QW835_07535 [Candidatus Hadarchaeum sp.]
MRKAKRILVTCPDCGEFFTLSVKEKTSTEGNFFCPNCSISLSSSKINAALDNAQHYNNLVDWFESYKDFGIELIFEDR